MKATYHLVFLFLLIGAACERNRGVPPKMDCIANLKQLDGAKETWVVEKHKTTNYVFTPEEITLLVQGVRPCRSGGVYILGRLGEKPSCSVEGHKLP